MRIERMIQTVDSHTAGEPTRVITGGLPHIPGETMVEKMNYFRKHLDFIRTSIIQEPRGHRDMIGAVLLPPSTKEADFGVFYMTPLKYLNMCGHGSIGVATIIVDIGLKEASEPITKVLLDTPAGVVTVNVHVKNGEVVAAGLVNVPSFLYADRVRILIPEIEELTVEVAFGGNFYILVNADALRITLSPENVPQFHKHSGPIADEVNKIVRAIHPEEKEVTLVRSVLFYGAPTHPQARTKTLLIGSSGTVDRSPCGTGTSAKMGVLYAHGELSQGDTYCTESIIGTLFQGKVLEEKKVGSFTAIVPEITGSAYITGFHQFTLESSDPLKHRFML
ncbi:MAG: proline racemase family protein [Thermodesulfobacteriota bacterium]|nr:proline racemase family protein [Thermodesulfobacteriota bacterium]